MGRKPGNIISKYKQETPSPGTGDGDMSFNDLAYPVA